MNFGINLHAITDSDFHSQIGYTIPSCVISSIFTKMFMNYMQAKEFVNVCMDNGVYDFDTAYM